jgi:hypothetical protein
MAEPTYIDLDQTGAEIQGILDTAVVTSDESTVAQVKVAVVTALPAEPDASTFYAVTGGV